MFTRLAGFPRVGSRHVVPAPIAWAFSNDSQADAELRQRSPRGRPALICRWRVDAASGKPECAWEIAGLEMDPAAAAPDRQVARTPLVLAFQRSGRHGLRTEKA